MTCHVCGIEADDCDRCPACGERMRDGFLSRLVAALTAFPDWPALVESMNAGYVPSIYASRGRRYRLLVRLVRSKGFPVFDGVKVF